jgi:hypothetical protein
MKPLRKSRKSASHTFEGTVEKSRFSVPSALRAPAAPQLNRSAAEVADGI